jgi:hypothetical protein
MRRFVAVAAVAVALVALGVVGAVSNAHFVGVPQVSVIDDTVTAVAKVAGLGNVTQIHAVLSGDAACINRGGKHPEAANKESFSAAGDFPVQNGKALIFLALEATFQPACNPPMSVAWSNIVLTVSADDGTFISYP